MKTPTEILASSMNIPVQSLAARNLLVPPSIHACAPSPLLPPHLKALTDFRDDFITNRAYEIRFQLLCEPRVGVAEAWIRQQLADSRDRPLSISVTWMPCECGRHTAEVYGAGSSAGCIFVAALLSQMVQQIGGEGYRCYTSLWEPDESESESALQSHGSGRACVYARSGPWSRFADFTGYSPALRRRLGTSWRGDGPVQSGVFDFVRTPPVVVVRLSTGHARRPLRRAGSN